MIGLFTGFLLYLLLVFTACAESGSSDTAPQETPDVLNVEVASVQQRDMADTLHLFGRVAFRQWTRLASQFAGRLEGLNLLPGDPVKKGQMVGILIPPQKEALSRLNSPSNPKLRRLVDQHMKAIPLTAPVSGSVTALFHHNGDVVQAGEAILDIGVLDRLQILVPVPLHYVHRIRRDLPAEVVTETDPPRRFTLPIQAMTHQVDVVQQAVTMRLDVPPQVTDVLAGAPCRVNLLLKSHPQAIVVPRSAILEWEGEYYVFVVEKETVKRTPVQTGIWQGEWVEIRSGLQPGQRIAVSKVYSLEDDMEVRVQ